MSTQLAASYQRGKNRGFRPIGNGEMGELWDDRLTSASEWGLCAIEQTAYFASDVHDGSPRQDHGWQFFQIKFVGMSSLQC